MESPNEWKTAGTSYGSDVLVHTISRSDLSLHEISKEQSEFQKAAFQFFTFTKYSIECVERVEAIEYGPDSEVRTSYEHCRESFAAQGLPTVESLVFHGTPSVENVRNIVTHGFKVGGVDKGVGVAHGSAHGPGVYTAISPSTPQQYARGTNAIILAKGLRGAQTQSHLKGKHANSVCPNPDWIIFRKGCQVLPLYVVYFNFGSPAYGGAMTALPVAIAGPLHIPPAAAMQGSRVSYAKQAALLKQQQEAERNKKAKEAAAEKAEAEAAERRRRIFRPLWQPAWPRCAAPAPPSLQQR